MKDALDTPIHNLSPAAQRIAQDIPAAVKKLNRYPPDSEHLKAFNSAVFSYSTHDQLIQCNIIPIVTNILRKAIGQGQKGFTYIRVMVHILLNLSANTSSKLIANEETLSVISSIYPLMPPDKEIVAYLAPITSSLLSNITRESSTIPDVIQYCPNGINICVISMDTPIQRDLQAIPLQFIHACFLGVTFPFGIELVHRIIRLVLESGNESAKKVFISKTLISVLDGHVDSSKDPPVLTMVQGIINELLLQPKRLEASVIQQIKVVVTKMLSSSSPNVVQYSKLLIDRLSCISGEWEEKVITRCGNNGCFVSEKLKRCGVCRSASYCSPECQKQAWKNGHKAECPNARENSLLMQGKRATKADNAAIIKLISEAWDEIKGIALLNGITDMANTVICRDFRSDSASGWKVMPGEHFHSEYYKKPPFNGRNMVIEDNYKVLQGLVVPGYLVVVIHPSTVSAHVLQLGTTIIYSSD